MKPQFKRCGRCGRPLKGDKCQSRDCQRLAKARLTMEQYKVREYTNRDRVD